MSSRLGNRNLGRSDRTAVAKSQLLWMSGYDFYAHLAMADEHAGIGNIWHEKLR